jgi:hypothetical protein
MRRGRVTAAVMAIATASSSLAGSVALAATGPTFPVMPRVLRWSETDAGRVWRADADCVSRHASVEGVPYEQLTRADCGAKEPKNQT